jgi:hypothetical protein
MKLVSSGETGIRREAGTFKDNDLAVGCARVEMMVRRRFYWTMLSDHHLIESSEGPRPFCCRVAKFPTNRGTSPTLPKPPHRVIAGIVYRI